MHKLPVPQTLISKITIRSHIHKMAKSIEERRHGFHVTFVPILNGAWRVMSRLMSHLDGVPMQFEPVMIRSYEGTQSGEATMDLLKLNEGMVRNRHVVIVDDILDSGQTLTLLRDHLREWKPKSLLIGVMLNKKVSRKPDFAIEPDFIGCHIANKFVVGMGLDYRGYYRNLSYIGVLSDQDRIAIDKIIDGSE